MLTATSRRRGALLIALAAVVAVLIATFSSPATAQQGDEQVDDEGGTRSLREQLDDATAAYQDAKAALDESEKRELKLTKELNALQDEMDLLVEDLQVVAANAYRTGRVGTFAALLDSSSPTQFVERVATVDMIAMRENEVLARLKEVTDSVEEQRDLIAAEVDLQEEELAKLDDAVKKAEQALFAVGGGDTGQFVAYESPLAKPAPRNPDGTWPGESCSKQDPTTSGCVTPRMLHAYEEARLFGFTRYTSCYRGGSFGEHPLGRACDFAAQPNGFGGVATGSDKEYGDRLASFFVTNADRLAVQYVIWYRQIWMPGTGWRSYSGSCGDPNCDHTNHVHVSIR